MPYEATIYRVLISAPSDVTQELKAIPEVVSSWNAVNSPRIKAFVEPVNWRSHSHPAAGERPQEIINQQIVEESDLMVAVFWTRLGTPTGGFSSGSVEEIEKFIKAKKPVLVYFSNQPVVPGSIDTEQYEKLRQYKEQIKSRVLYAEYNSIWEFRELLSRHIGQTINGLIKNLDTVQEEHPANGTAEIERERIGLFLEHLSEILRRYEIEWNAEKQSSPVNTDDAKFMMDRFGEELLYLGSQIAMDKDGFLSNSLDEAIGLGKKIRDHQMYIDGGKSYSDFWRIGDEMIAKAKNGYTYLKEEYEKNKG